MKRPRPSLRSTTARLAWGAAAAFLAGFWLLSAVAYVTLSSLLEYDARERAMADAGGLADLYRRDGREVLVSEVRQRVADGIDPDALYAVIDARTGALLAGNLRDMPPSALRTGWLSLADEPEGTPRRVHVSRLDGGIYLAAGLEDAGRGWLQHTGGAHGVDGDGVRVAARRAAGPPDRALGDAPPAPPRGNGGAGRRRRNRPSGTARRKR
ncbi:MAG: hypothetical protein NVV67_07025 [Pseudoxanthomonas sp.]|nr:hypothetical protein [Pseudoxanthomonas sp.]